MKFVVTVDDAGPGQALEAEHRSIDYFRGHDVPATFFVVPCGGNRPLTDAPDWVRRARQYVRRGHEFELHGCTHAGFEFGAPPSWMVQICGDAMIAAEAAGYPDFQDDWRPEVLRTKFARAVSVFEQAFERPPRVFRAGCLAAGPEAIAVLPEFGIHYDSNRVVDPKTWDYIVQRFDSRRPWDPAVPPRPYRLSAELIELPMIGEYAWTLSPDTLHHFIDLALEDLARVDEAGGVFILICHQQRVGGEDPLPRRVLDEILTSARRNHRAEFLTLGTLIEQIERGEQPVAETTSRI